MQKWRPEGWRPKGLGPKGWGPEGWGDQNFAFFFPSPAPIFALFLSLWVSSRWMMVVFSKAGSPQMCTFGLSGCLVKPPRPNSRRGFTRQPESPNVDMSGSRPPKNTTKIPRKDPLRERERERESRKTENCRGRGGKKRNFVLSGGGGVRGRGPKSWTNTQTDAHRQTHTDRHTQTDTHRQTHTDRHTQTDTHRQTHTDRHTQQTHTTHTKSTIWANWPQSNWLKSTSGLSRKNPDWPKSNWP